MIDEADQLRLKKRQPSVLAVLPKKGLIFVVTSDQ
jgi:hypothetical protein